MNGALIKVLLVESDPRYARHLRESLSALTASRFDLISADTLAAAIQQVRHEQFEAALLNLTLLDSDGFVTFSRFSAEAPDLPIVILTCCENESLALEAVRAGAQDYLVKSKVDGKILSRVTRYAIERKRSEKKLLAANRELMRTNQELARSEDALRHALGDLKASHENLQNAQLQLMQAEKMECVGKLAAGVAHEVKNPLQTILMGLAYLSRNQTSVDDTALMVFTDMKDAVKRADAIVRDLLYLSAARQIEIKPADINAIVERSLCLVNYDLTRTRILVARRLEPSLPLALVDKPKIEQVLINLFMNSIQAMPQGGTLWVATTLAEHDGSPRIQITIEDTGSGIPSDKLKKVFEPFFTTIPNGVGTGLGLPVSKQIIDLHRGSIQLGPGTRGGTCAIVELRTEPQPQSNPAHEKEAHFIGR